MSGMDIDFSELEDLDSKPVLIKGEPVDITDLSSIGNAPPANIKKKEESHPSWLDVHASLAVAGEESLGPLSGSTSAAVQASKINATEEDGSLRFFWLDYLELEGKVHFIGKLKDKTSGQWVSCSITVENLQRNLFVLPRERRHGWWKYTSS